MGNFVRTLILVFMVFTASATDAFVSRLIVVKPKKIDFHKELDLVMIDTGQSHKLSGVLNMPEAPCKMTMRSWCWHGTYMAAALKDQLEIFKANPINAQQLAWAEPKDIPVLILKAADMNPRVISMSLSGVDPMDSERNAIAYATAKGILVIAASGNEGMKRSGYPGGYGFDCLVSVSTTEKGKKVSTANAGEVYLPQEKDEWGTSFSAARAGAYAMSYFQYHPDATCKDVKRALVRAFGHP